MQRNRHIDQENQYCECKQRRFELQRRYAAIGERRSPKIAHRRKHDIVARSVECDLCAFGAVEPRGMHGRCAQFRKLGAADGRDLRRRFARLSEPVERCNGRKHRRGIRPHFRRTRAAGEIEQAAQHVDIETGQRQ